MAEVIEPVARQNGRIIRISAIWERGGIFRETITCDEILNPLESLLGSNIEFVLNRHNHIYLRDAGSSHSLELHRDVRHWSRTIATVLVYLEDTNLENGCTRVVPGSHHLPAFADLHRRCAIQGNRCGSNNSVTDASRWITRY